MRDDAAAAVTRQSVTSAKNGSWHRTGPCGYEIREYERANGASRRRWIIRTRAVGCLKVTAAAAVVVAAVEAAAAEAVVQQRYHDVGRGHADRPILHRCDPSNTACARPKR